MISMLAQCAVKLKQTIAVMKPYKSSIKRCCLEVMNKQVVVLTNYLIIIDKPLFFNVP